MKHFAVILCTYILALAAAPLVQFYCARSAAKCGASCPKETMPVDKKENQCDNRGCCLLICCYASLTLFLSEEGYSFRHYFAANVENNFNRQPDFTTIDLFDIWHPPRLA